MKKLHLAIIIPCLLFASSVMAADDQSMQTQTQGDVSFISGGVGAEEQAELQAVQADYNVSLLFSEKGGEYLSDVNVRITDGKGNVVLETLANGPKLFAKLHAGHYNISVERNGTEFHKTVTVGHKRTALSFVWPREISG
jgi:hypothetical protein